MNKKIIFGTIVLLAVVLVASLFVYNGRGIDKDMGMDVLKQAQNDSVKEEDLESVMNELGYKYYKDGSDGNKHSYIKKEGDKVTFETSSIGEVSEYEYIYSKDYSTPEDDVSFVLTKTSKTDRYIFSIASDKNTILIEKAIYTKNKDNTTVTYEHYTYNVEKNEFKFKYNGSEEKEGSIKYSDIKKDLNSYFDEFSRIYPSK